MKPLFIMAAAAAHAFTALSLGASGQHTNAHEHQPGLPEQGVERYSSEQEGRSKWTVTSERWFAPNVAARNVDPPCERSADPRLKRLLTTLYWAAEREPSLQLLATPVAAEFASKLDSELQAPAGFVADLLFPDRPAHCGIVVVIVPVGALIESIEFRIGDGDRGVFTCSMRLVGETDCRLAANASLSRLVGIGQVFGVMFNNDSADRGRWGSLAVSFLARSAGPLRP